VFYIYGIFDAMEVAEINNLAYRDRQKNSSMQLNPGINPLTGQAELNMTWRYTLSN
jgi:hypothetical protein